MWSNRDSAWYSLLGREWPAARGAFERRLAPESLDAGGAQRTRPADLRA